MRLVIVESPFAGNIEMNVRYGRACIRDSILRGEAPIASHLLYTQPGILDDNILHERMLGIACGHEWMRRADLVAVYQDLGISPGMSQGIMVAGTLGVMVEYRSGIAWIG